MKKIIIATTSLFIFLSCYCQKNTELIGAWEMTYQHWTTADTIGERNITENFPIKVLSKEYFSFCAESGRGHTGKYSYDGKTYKESIQYGYNPSLVNQTSEFKSKIEDNKWYIEGTIMLDGHEVKLKETWQRID